MNLPEISPVKALEYEWFPTPWQAALFRNWGMVPAERICRALGAEAEQLREAAQQLGLDPRAQGDPVWLKRGYLTLIRNNWQLMDYTQICDLLDITPDRLAVLLKEDDFLWHKLGWIRPTVSDTRYRMLTREEKEKTDQFRQKVQALGIDRLRENAFSFIDDFSRPTGNDCVKAPDGNVVRTVYSYFALYGDPLLDAGLDPFPDALLEEYARMGVKGIWLQGVLYQLVPFPFQPELSEGWEKRIDRLNDLIQRAARCGIGVFLYLNEPRSMNDAFFTRFPELRGTREGDFYAMCTSQNTVKKYLYDAAHELFTRAKGLRGFFTISMSENLTNCYSRKGDMCPRCASRKPWEVVAEVNNLLARGAHDADPKAQAIAWSWAWPEEWAEKVPPLLTEGQIVQCVSEEAIPTRIGGIPGEVRDYSMSICGPGEKAKRVWRAALESGHEVSAKVQFNCTWEMSAIPWIPVMDRVAEHVNGLMEAGVKHLQYSWTLGGYPSPNLKLAGYLMDRRGDVHSFIREWLGEKLGETADRAQSCMSTAFREFPFHISSIYTGPQNYGPMTPFYPVKTGWKATMVGYPYDDLDTWRSIYPREVYRDQFAKLVSGWKHGVEIMRPLAGQNADYDDMLFMAEGTLVHFTSTWNQIRFVMARDNGDAEGMLEAIQSEKTNVERAIQLREKDSRLGFEASNHYYYTIRDLGEKLLNLEWCERKIAADFK